MVTKEIILEALSRIIDPDFGKDIVALGFVRNLRIDEGHVSLDIQLTTPACPLKSEFQQKATDYVTRIDGVRSVKINMTARGKTDEPAREVAGSSLTNVNAVIAISSCKGGVGKSTVAACLARNLASRGFKIGLLDCDIYGPSVPSLFHLHRPAIYTNQENQVIPVEAQGLKLMSFGFLIGDAPAVMRGPLVSRYVQQLVHATAWGELDYLFIDLPPGTGDIQLTITQSVRLNGAVIVTTPQTLSLVDVSRGILMFEKVQVPMLGVISNMAYFQCDGCGKKHFIFGEEDKEKLEGRFGLETLAQFPVLTSLAKDIEDVRDHPVIAEAVDNVVRALGKSRQEEKHIPEIIFDEKETTLKWPDGETLTLPNKDLRLSCRCAVCVDELTGEVKIAEKDIRPDIQPVRVTALGNYAVGIEWNDGHSSGIYPYRNIRELAQKSPA